MEIIGRFFLQDPYIEVKYRGGNIRTIAEAAIVKKL